MVTELPEQTLVGQLPRALVEDEPADRLQDRAGRGLGHHAVPFGRNGLSGYIVPPEAGRGRFFFKVTTHPARLIVRFFLAPEGAPSDTRQSRSVSPPPYTPHTRRRIDARRQLVRPDPAPWTGRRNVAPGPGQEGAPRHQENRRNEARRAEGQGSAPCRVEKTWAY